MLTGCANNPRYHITVLQCSEGNWRNKLNNELLAAQHLYEEDVEVEILNCYDRSDVQVRQIDSLTNLGVDLMVVAPNEYAEVAPALRRAKERNIPVILFLFSPLGHPRFQVSSLTRLHSACCSSLIPSITLWDKDDFGET